VSSLTTSPYYESRDPYYESRVDLGRKWGLCSMLLTPPSGEKHVLPNMIEAGDCNCLCNKPHTSGPTNSAHLVTPSENTNNTAHKAGAKQCSNVVGDALFVLQRPVAAHSEAAQKHQQISEGSPKYGGMVTISSGCLVSFIERRDRRNSLARSFTQT
jgi:hypothetical protein